MTTEAEGTPQEEEYARPDPKMNPRNIALEEIAKSVAKTHTVDAAETVDSIDDEGNITPAKPAVAAEPESEAAAPVVEETPAEPTPSSEPASAEPAASPDSKIIDPNADYDVEIDGQKVSVKGQKIIDAGFRTFQKETAADFRLNVASQLLREAEARFAATQTGAKADEPAGGKPVEISDAELAKMIQFGSPEQSAEAIKTLRSRGAVSAQEIQSFVAQQTRAAARDEIAFQKAQDFVQTEYGDLLKNEMIKRLFYTEENRRRAPRERGGEGDSRPYQELYKDIGDSLRKGLNLPKPGASAAPSPSSSKPTATAAQRQAAKASTPAVPRTAASRLAAADTAAKVKTPTEIIAGMAEARGKTSLAPRLRKE